MDVHVHGGITAGLRIREVDVLTAQEDGADRLDDDPLLDRAAVLGRVLFSNDTDMLAIAHRRQEAAIPFAGVVFAPQSSAIGRLINDLELCAKACELRDFENVVTFIPF